MKTDNTIYQTKDYDLFYKVEGNRPVNTTTREYKKIRDSIKNNGLLYPILVDSDLSIAEGQHRAKICEELGIPIEYIIRAGVKKRIIELNNDRKNWKTIDYINYFIGKNSYRKLRDMMEESGLSANTVHTILKGKEISKDQFYCGEFKISNKEIGRYNKAKEKLDDIINIQNSKFKGALKRSRVVPQIVELILHKRYIHRIFLNNLSKEVAIPSVNKKSDAVRLLLGIYNKHVPKTKRILDLGE